jgi:hypothetical protein
MKLKIGISTVLVVITAIFTAASISFAEDLITIDDLIFNGTNGWIFHTPDDGRTSMFIAPKNEDGDWDWSNNTKFDANGDVEFNGKIIVNESIKINGNILSDGDICIGNCK